VIIVQILELHTLTSAQIDDLLVLMQELDPTIPVTAEMLERAVRAPGTHFFAAVEEIPDQVGNDGSGQVGNDEGKEISRLRSAPPEMTMNGRIIGCASLCVFESPTGRKASVEDVVVGEGFRGQGIGRALMEHLIDFVRRELAPVDLHLTSRPERVAANTLYRSLGFERRETNVYRMRVQGNE
jgi:ribosomal protein S18 acetylase RimI-like enzyme